MNPGSVYIETKRIQFNRNSIRLLDLVLDTHLLQPRKATIIIIIVVLIIIILIFTVFTVPVKTHSINIPSNTDIL